MNVCVLKIATPNTLVSYRLQVPGIIIPPFVKFHGVVAVARFPKVGPRSLASDMPPATKEAARPKIAPPKGGSAPGATPPVSTRRGNTGKVDKKGAAADGAPEEPTRPPAAAKSKSKGKDLPSTPAESKDIKAAKAVPVRPGDKPSYMKSTGTNKRSKMTRAERLAEEEEIEYGGEGGWSLEKWCDSLQLHKVVAEALSAVPSDDADGVRPFEHAKSLSRDEIERRLSAAKLEGLTDAIAEGVEMLKEQGAASGADLNHKFHVRASDHATMRALRQTVCRRSAECARSPARPASPRAVRRWTASASR